MTGKGNGTATITVQDGNGTTASYPVSVTNKYNLVYPHPAGNHTHMEAVTWMRSQSATPCIDSAVRVLEAVYGKPIPFQQKDIWLCNPGDLSPVSANAYNHKLGGAYLESGVGLTKKMNVWALKPRQG